MTDLIRIANCSGFLGDRQSAAREMVEGGPIDVLTGDWLAELTMLILFRQKLKRGYGYATPFLAQLEEVLGTCVDRDIRIVSNAGGLDPAALGEAAGELADRLGVPLRIGVVSGDDLMPAMADLQAEGEAFLNLDTGETLAEVGVQPITANAYLGAEPIAQALAEGAQLVVTGRVTDASVVVGPAAWFHGWDFAAARAGDQLTLDRLAGAVAAGHIIECGAQATGGNYAFFQDVPGLEHPGLPIAEIANDGSAIITKHPGSGGMVTVGTVTAQLLYEIGRPEYANPDVTARFDTLALQQVGRDRVAVNGCRGLPAPERLKVAMNYLGGYRNSLTVVLTGLDPEAKADLLLRTVLGLSLEECRAGTRDPHALAAASRLDVTELSVDLVLSGVADPAGPSDAQSFLRITAKSPNAESVGKPFTVPIIEATLSSFPGLFPTTPPGPSSPVGVYWPTTVARAHVEPKVTVTP